LKKIKKSSRKAPRYPKLEEKLFILFKDMREEKLPVSYSGFKTEALKISSDLGQTNFKASNGYLQKFFLEIELRKESQHIIFKK